jgi:hypothetical protein
MTHPGFNGKVAMAMYSGTSLLAAIAFSALWGYALTHPALLDDRVDVAQARRLFPRFAVGGLFYLALIALSFVSPQLTLAVVFALAVYYAFERLPTGTSAVPTADR